MGRAVESGFADATQQRHGTFARFGSNLAADQLITRKVAAALLGVSARALGKMADRGEITAIPMPYRRELRYRESDIRGLIHEVQRNRTAEASNRIAW